MTGEAELTAVAVSEEVREWLPVATMADLRLMKPTAKRFIQLLGYTSAGDGGGGEFYWDSASSATDNGGTVIAADAGGVGRWRRIVTNSTVTIQQFGADGSGDDKAFIQAALDSGHSIVEANDGTFGIASSLTVPAGVLFRGDATLTVTGTPDAENSVIKLAGVGAAVEGLTINVTAGDYRRTVMLDASRTRASRLKINVTTNDIPALTAHFTFFSSDLPNTFDDVEVSDNDVQGSNVPIMDGVQASGHRGMKVLRNRFHDMTVDVPDSHYWGIYLATDCQDCLIADNIIEDTDGGGIHINSVVGTPNRRINIRGNVIRDMTYYGISIDDYCYDCSATENKVSGTSQGIFVSANAARPVIVGNTVKQIDTAAASDGALIACSAANALIACNLLDDRGSGGLQGIHVVGAGCAVVSNVFGTTRPRVAIKATSAATGLVVSGNSIAASDDSTGGGALDIDAAGAAITGNRIIATASAGWLGIRIAASNVVVTANVISGANVGIFVSSGTSNIIQGNQFTGFASSAISDSGTTTRIRQNVGYTTENGGTGSIASGATTATVTHGLSKTPTAAQIGVIFTEQGTNDYGRWWISGITSTQFVVNVSADPGASNLDFSWQAAIL